MVGYFGNNFSLSNKNWTKQEYSVQSVIPDYLEWK